MKHLPNFKRMARTVERLVIGFCIVAALGMADMFAASLVYTCVRPNAVLASLENLDGGPYCLTTRLIATDYLLTMRMADVVMRALGKPIAWHLRQGQTPDGIDPAIQTVEYVVRSFDRPRTVRHPMEACAPAISSRPEGEVVFRNEGGVDISSFIAHAVPKSLSYSLDGVRHLAPCCYDPYYTIDCRFYAAEKQSVEVYELVDEESSAPHPGL